jgi:hypothetical protein
LIFFQHKLDRPRRFSGRPEKTSGVDLMIVDVPENLPVPNISATIPPWNALDKNFVDLAFDFANNHIHDDGALLLFHAEDPSLNSKLRAFMKAYHFRLFKEWMGVNRLRLRSAKDSSKTVSTNVFIAF